VANRQVYRDPSEEIRTRLQVEQKLWVTLEMIPISPPPSRSRQRAETSPL